MNIFVLNLVIVLSILVVCYPGGNIVTGATIDTGRSSTSSATSTDAGRKIASGSESAGNDLLPNQYGLLFGQNAEGEAVSVGNWLDYGSLLLGVVASGQLYLLLWAFVPIYYTLFAVTDPAELQRRSGRSATGKNSTGVTPTPAGWNFQRIVKMVSLAVETYQELDMSELDCQKKLLCELQDGKDMAATTTRALSNVLLYFDFFKRVPHIEEYREAIKTGQRRMLSRSSADKCDYQKCKFSLSSFNEKYRRLLHS